ncbi:MAG: DUF6011 domain-containing protein [Candidatus Hermodarchaeota archaeon]
MVVLCKRCGRPLRSAKSIKLGYGPTCYRLSKTQDNSFNIEQEITFLKIELKTLKKLLRELKTVNLSSSQSSPIIRINREMKRPEQNQSKGRMKEVVQELKSCFQECNGDVKRLLNPIPIEINLMDTSQLAVA